MKFYEFLQPRTICEAISLFLAAAICCGISAGLLLYFGKYTEIVIPKDERLYYGRVRMLQVGKEELIWRPVYSNNTAIETIEKMSFIVKYLSQSLAPTSQMLQSVAVTGLYEDEFTRLLKTKNRGVIVAFEVAVDVPFGLNVTNEEIKSDIMWALDISSAVVVSLESIELNDVILDKLETYDSFETYLAGDRVVIDLSLTETPMEQLPEALSNISCPSFMPPENGEVFPSYCGYQSNLTTVSVVCAFTCSEGYSLLGVDSITCLSTGFWSDIVPICKAECSPLSVSYGVNISPFQCFEYSSFSEGRCYYYCQNDKVLEGATSAQCSNTGEWVVGPAFCKETCASIGIPDYGEVFPQSCVTDPILPAGTICSFLCRKGYSLVGSSSIQCDVDGMWNFPVPVCRRGCPTLVPVENGDVYPEICTSLKYVGDVLSVVAEGVYCDFSCNDSYILNGPKQRYCEGHGAWSGTDVYCLRLCPLLELPYLMLANPAFCTNLKETSKLVEGLTCNLFCPKYYRTSSDITKTTCLSNGTWTRIPHRCLRICPGLEIVQNAKLTPSLCESSHNVTEGTTCSLNCEEGFDIRGIGSATCLDTGKWTNVLGSCLKRCPPLLAPEYGGLNPSGCIASYLFEGSLCTYVCDLGYTVIGNLQRVCLSDGTWSSTEPFCKEQTQFMIWQSTADHDVCLSVNQVTLYVEKLRSTSCSSKNKVQNWNVLPNSLIINIEYQQCLTAEHPEAGSFIKIAPCDETNELQLWKWQDMHGLQMILKNTQLHIGYGFASVGNVMLVNNDENVLNAQIPWYAITSDGVEARLEGLLRNVSCLRLRKPLHVNVFPPQCIDNQTLPTLTLCGFSCPVGRKLRGSFTRQCINGDWTDSYPTCEIVCPPVMFSTLGGRSIEPANCSFDSQDEYTVCMYQCTDSKYALEGEEFTFCKGNGKWSSTPPLCIVHCPQLSVVDKGSIFPKDCVEKNMRIGSKCLLGCDYPYMPAVPSERTCMSYGSWSNLPFECHRGCVYPEANYGEFAEVSCSKQVGLSTGDECVFTCGPFDYQALAYHNYTTGDLILAAMPGPNGNITRTCQSNGLFDGISPMCVNICWKLRLPQNGYFDPPTCTTTFSAEGAICIFSCGSGYGQRGAKFIECQSEGRWSDYTYYCEEEIQFYIINQDVFPFEESALIVNFTSIVDDVDAYTIHKFTLPDNISDIAAEGLWTWKYNHLLQHTETGFCLSVADRNAPRNTLLVLRHCSEYDLAQQWVSSFDNFLFLPQYELYVSYGDVESDYPIAERHQYTEPSPIYEQWYGQSTDEALDRERLGNFYSDSCSPFYIPHNSVAEGEENCDGDSLGPVGTVCFLRCKSGYIFSETTADVVIARCSELQKWTFDVSDNATSFTCKRYCPPLTITFGRISMSDSCVSGRAFYKDVCEFTCQDNTILIGSSVSICGVNGHWSSPAPICSNICTQLKPSGYSSDNRTVPANSVDCPYSDIPYSGLILSGRTCHYFCDPPYFPVFPRFRECLSSGEFNRENPVCNIPETGGTYFDAMCSAPPPPIQSVGKFLSKGLCEIGNLSRICAWYSCIPGFKILSANFIHCSAETYAWGAPPLCRRTCPNIFQCYNYTEGETCLITCNGTTTLSHGNNKILCQSDGTWSDLMPTCEEKEQCFIAVTLASIPYCLTYNSSYTGLYSLDLFVKLTLCSLLSTNDRSASWSWEGPYLLRHTQSSYCLTAESITYGARIKLSECNELDVKQQWRSSDLASAPYLISLKHSKDYVLASSSYFQDVASNEVRLVIYDPYSLGTSLQIDMNLLSWTAICSAHTNNLSNTIETFRSSSTLCPPLADLIPEGGYMRKECLQQRSARGEVCLFECKNGFVRSLTSGTYTQCMSNGVWSITSFQCSVTCPMPPKPEYGTFECNCNCDGNSDSLPVEGEKCQLNCDVGYQVFGEKELICQHNGKWSESEKPYPVCGRLCPKLALPPFSTVDPIECTTSVLNFNPGSNCLYKCIEGYRMTTTTSDFIESDPRTCLVDGTWSGYDITCGRVCSPLLNPNNGKFSPITCLTSESVSGFECQLECNEGYAVYGEEKRICGEGGNWINFLTDDFGPPCRSICPDFVPFPHINTSCTLFGRYASFIQPKTGTVCKSLCHKGYGFTPDSAHSQTCLGNGRWNHRNLDCVKENQFVIFLLRTSSATDKMHICLISDENGNVKKVDHTVCLNDPSPYHRWTWFQLSMLKNAATGLCLAVKKVELSERVVTASCIDESYSKEWSSKNYLNDGSSYFFKIVETDFYVDSGAAYTDKVFLHDSKSLDPSIDDVHWYARSYDPEGFLQLSDALPTPIAAKREKFGICPSLDNPKFGRVYPYNCLSLQFTIEAYTQCSFRCDVGYKLADGPRAIICLPNGLWSSLIPTCSRICPPINNLGNGVVTPQSCILPESPFQLYNSGMRIGVLSGRSCKFECDDGWVLDGGPEMVTCLGNGMWNSKPPICKKICQPLIQPFHTTALDPTCLTSQKLYGDVCSFKCVNGYGIPNHDSDCSPDTVVLATNLGGNTFCETIDEFVKITEETSTHFGSVLHRTCSKQGVWLGRNPVCFRLCESLPVPEHGVVFPISCISQNQVPGTTCMYGCEDMYFIRGKHVNYTCVEGAWVPTAKVLQNGFDASLYLDTNYKLELPACDRHCYFLTPIPSEHSTYIPPSCTEEMNPVGSVCEKVCEADYVLRGNPRIKCQSDGTWDNIVGECIQRCPALKIPLNGNIIPYHCTTANVGDGDVCTFVCNEKYAIFGESVLTCTGFKTWPNLPICKRRCPPLPTFYNGQVAIPYLCYSELIVEEDVCSFYCNDGFYLLGNPDLTCLSNGKWSHPVPGCHRVCELPLMLNGLLSCMIRGDFYSGDELIGVTATWGSFCSVQCDSMFAPTGSASFFCQNNGRWQPSVPKCQVIEVPMYISQKIGAARVCVVEEFSSHIVKQIPLIECLDTELPDYSTAAAWRWLNQFNIQNARSGRCLSVQSLNEGEILRTSLCNPDDGLQRWECSIYHPFKLVLNGSNLSPTTFYRDLGVLVLQEWSDVHSYFTTFDLVTFSHSSICSRRTESQCPPLHDIENGRVEPAECKSQLIPNNLYCFYRCDTYTIVVSGPAYTVCMSNGIWSNPPPVCSAFCKPLYDLRPASYLKDTDCIFKPSPIGKVCKVFCKDGYEAIGDVNVQCIFAGRWSDFAYQCLRVCPAIFGLLNGKISPSPCTSDACSFSCLPGYKIDGARSLTCETDGRWSDRVPLCIRDSQFRIVSKSSLNSRVLCLTVRDIDHPLQKMSCTSDDNQDPYQLFKWVDNSNEIMHPASNLCIHGSPGRWEFLMLAECHRGYAPQVWDCGEIPGIDDFCLQLSTTKFYMDTGAQVDVYDQIEISSVLNNVVLEKDCFDSSQWYGAHYYASGTVCSFRDIGQCSRFPLIDHGQVIPEDCRDPLRIIKGLICKVACDEGYVLQQAEHSSCQADGTWSIPLPSCTGIFRCDALIIEDNLLRIDPPLCTGKFVPEGTWCYFTCPSDHYLYGEKYARCLNSGVWSSDPPICRPHCPALGYIRNGTIDPPECYGSNNAAKSFCHFTCNEYHRLLGSVNRTCSEDGNWSGEETMCMAFCETLPRVLHVTIFPDRCTNNVESQNYDGNTCAFRCDENYFLVGPEYITCNNGRWEPDIPICMKMAECEELIPGKDGFDNVFYQNLVLDIAIGFDTKVTVTCQRGYILLDERPTRVCTPQGQWEGGTPICLKVCDPIMPPNHGSFVPNHCSYKYQKSGETCTAICEASWNVSGPSEIKCYNGSWSSVVPSCIGGSEFAGQISSQPFSLIYYRASSLISSCLMANPTAHIIERSTDCDFQSKLLEEVAAYFFRWKGNLGQIESVSIPDYCLVPYYLNSTVNYMERYYVKLGLEPCNEDVETQRFECGDVSLRQFVFRIASSNLWIGQDKNVNLNAVISVDMVTSDAYHVLDWNAFSFETTNRFSLESIFAEDTSLDTACNQKCGGELILGTGALASPGYPSFYSINTVCQWFINGFNRIIHLWITDLDVDYGTAGDTVLCNKDFVSISEGERPTIDGSNIIAKVCGERLHAIGAYTSYVGRMWVTFHSDNNLDHRRGFRATWSVEEYPAYIEECQNLEREEAYRNMSITLSSRIVGGTPVTPISVPWQASIFKIDSAQWVCSAVIISQTFVLTAAHCVESVQDYSDMNHIIFAYGSAEIWRLSRVVRELRQIDSSILSVSNSDGSEAIRLNDIFIHPDFDARLQNDIALLVLSQPLIWDQHVYPACLPPSSLIDEALGKKGNYYYPTLYCKLVGWESEEKREEMFGTLVSIDIPVWSDRYCSFASSNTFGRKLAENMFCAGHVDGTRQSPCEGGVGGGLVCEWNENYYVIGIASHQLGNCSLLNAPRYFTRVAAVRDWIDVTMIRVKSGETSPILYSKPAPTTVPI